MFFLRKGINIIIFSITTMLVVMLIALFYVNKSNNNSNEQFLTINNRQGISLNEAKKNGFVIVPEDVPIVMRKLTDSISVAYQFDEDINKTVTKIWEIKMPSVDSLYISNFLSKYDYKIISKMDSSRNNTSRFHIYNSSTYLYLSCFTYDNRDGKSITIFYRYPKITD